MTAKLLITFGALLMAMGVIVHFVGQLPGIGRLPGDILVKRGPVTFYFPLATCLIVSLVLSLFFSVFWRR